MVGRAARAARQRGVLQRRDWREDSGIDEATQRTDGRARPGRILQRICGAYFDDVSRWDDLRTAAQRAGHRGTGDAEHHGDVSAGAEGLGLRLDESATRDDRGEEAGVCGSSEIRRRPGQTEITGDDAAFETMGRAKDQIY